MTLVMGPRSVHTRRSAQNGDSGQWRVDGAGEHATDRRP